MRRALDLLGMPVICLETGEQIGTVQDILCDSHLHMLGVVLQLQSLFQPGTYIPANHIYAVGDDYLTVLDSGAITPLEQLVRQDTVLFFTGKQKLKGKTVLTSQGDSLGTIEDVYFSHDLARLVGCELSEGWITDLTEGRKRLPVTPSLMVGKESLILDHPTDILS